MKNNVTRYISKPLWKQDMRSNALLIIVILIIMCLMSTVVNFACSTMEKEKISEKVAEAQEDFFTYMFTIASFDAASGTDLLSYEDFVKGNNRDMYKQLFDNANRTMDMNLSLKGLENAIDTLKTSPVSIKTYLKNFEYAYSLSSSKGVFSGDKLELEDVVISMLEMSGMSEGSAESFTQMDTSTMLNMVYFHAIGLLPLFILIVVMGNGLIASQVDRGSLAYTLSTPTRRRAVSNTQALFMIIVPFVVITIVCISRIITTDLFFDEVCVQRIVVQYVGMYVLAEAICGICYLGSCWFNQSKKSLAFGGGLSVWFFLSSLLGVFGTDELVNMGVGVEEIGVFNNLTIVTLYDINAISTIGTDNVDTCYVWKLAILVGIASICYIAGSIKFNKKDLPL